MLKSLSIINYALIESLAIDFEDGFSVITGETGAGKSIIIGALSLLLGKRADPTILRDSTKKCIVEGVFDNGSLQLQNVFADNDLDYDDQTIFRREILPSGKSRAFINDTPVNLGLLSNIGNRFVNIHSQHQTMQLSDSSFQLNVLDGFISKQSILIDYQDIYTTYISLSDKLEKLIEQNAKAIKDQGYFNFQFDELSAASLKKEVMHELEERARFLEHVEEIKQALSETEAILGGDETSVIDSINNLERIIGNIQPYLSEAKELTKRISTVSIELKDILYDVESLDNDDDFDPMELQLVNDKLSVVYSLIQKHNVQTVEELIVIRDEYEQKLLNISSLDDEIIGLQKELVIVESNIKQKAKLLHEARQKASDNFSVAVTKVLMQLGMKDAGFNVHIELLPNYTTTGIDKVLFMFNANLGIKPGEISKIASGGELSRLMLAIKSLINKKQMLPTVIFDEIDTGVSGDIAGKVAGILKNMAQNHQVISISHLPQIASKADHHYKVYKLTEKNTTISTISKLADEERVEEVAQMLSSEKVTETAMGVARELLDNPG